MSVGKKVKPGHLRGWLAAVAWLIAGASLAGPASAGSFRVNPVQISLPAGRQATSLTITNSDVAPVSVRVIAYAWSQANGLDVYTPTTNLIVSPPIFTIAAGQTQLIRIGLKTANRAAAYRVIFEEIPREKPLDGQIQVTLKMNLPLYLPPKGGGTANIGWRAWRDPSGELFIEGSNRGTLHGQFVELSADIGGQHEILSRQMGVILPGGARLWKIGKRPDFRPGVPFILKARSPAGETQTQIVLEQR